ncbi:transcriptional repressor LexA [Patescibacteria group bacterium]|nr:transcriptional repressor LexA [Patescibacteria group bacterium]
MQPLTKRQKEILDFIAGYVNENGYAPSYREIAEYFSFSSLASVTDHIQALKDKKALDNEFNAARSIQLTPQFEEQTFDIPLMGAIAAGSPIQAIRTRETISIPRDMMGKNTFALKVRGDSMEDEGILDGDYVVIEKTEKPRNGDIVVALVDNDYVTLKKYFREKTRIRLQPANAKYRPIFTKNATIQGKVKGVIRRFTH